MFAFTFKRKEAEEFVLLEGSANGAAKLLTAVTRMLLTLTAQAIRNLFIRVQRRVTKVTEERTVIDVGALFGDHVDGRAF